GELVCAARSGLRLNGKTEHGFDGEALTFATMTSDNDLEVIDLRSSPAAVHHIAVPWPLSGRVERVDEGGNKIMIAVHWGILAVDVRTEEESKYVESAWSLVPGGARIGCRYTTQGTPVVVRPSLDPVHVPAPALPANRARWLAGARLLYAGDAKLGQV